MRGAKGPQFIRFFKPVLEVLKETGGSGTAAEVIDRVVEKMKISEGEQQATNKNGQSRVKNQVNWARLYLVHAGYLDSSKRGIWSLTEKGMSFDPQRFDVLGTFKQVQRYFRDEQKPANQEDAFEEETVESEVETRDHRAQLLSLIKLLPPAGFERLSQRLLRESGFQQVVVTGRSGDGGIDGMGILQVNPFVSFNVLFQCKRY
jgi:restriction system protein